jgi:type IV pilus assembly protein PilC
MAKYEYIALDARGQESRGVIEAATQNEAVGKLRQDGFFPTNVVEEGKGGLPKPDKKQQKAMAAAAAPKAKKGAMTLFSRKSIKSKTLMIFTRQLATLIDAGLPLLRGLTVLAKQEKDYVLKNTINALADAVQGGSTFSESMAQHPRIFNKLYINMVKAGELGGVLELVLNRLAEFQEKAQKIKNKVMSCHGLPRDRARHCRGYHGLPAHLHRSAVSSRSLRTCLVTSPCRASLSSSLTLPTFSRRTLFAVIGVIVAIVVIYKLIARSEKGRILIDRIKLRAPLFGDLTRKSSISRFSRTLGTLVTSGVPILQALNITRDTAGNHIVADAVTKVHDAVKEGESIVAPLEASGVFPPMVISMVDVGEETGQLPEMLLKIAEVYDDEVDNAVEGLTSLLEPIMIVFLALIVGTIVIALFLPLIQIIQGLSGQQ